MSLRKLLTLVCIAGVNCNPETPPQWSQTYTVSGHLILPFAEVSLISNCFKWLEFELFLFKIMEKFDAFYDANAGKSRIDYYGGMDKALQLASDGPFGKMLKIVPMTTETVFNEINCFAVPGDTDNPVVVQSILPDLVSHGDQNSENF